MCKFVGAAACMVTASTIRRIRRGSPSLRPCSVVCTLKLCCGGKFSLVSALKLCCGKPQSLPTSPYPRAVSSACALCVVLWASWPARGVGASSLPATSCLCRQPLSSVIHLKDVVRRLLALLFAQSTQPNMGLFSLNGSFLQIFIPLNAATVGALIIIKLFIDKFELSMLPFKLAAADAPYVTMTAYVPLVMVTNLATVFYVLLGEGGSYNNSDSRAQKATFTGLKARVSSTARFAYSFLTKPQRTACIDGGSAPKHSRGRGHPAVGPLRRNIQGARRRPARQAVCADLSLPPRLHRRM